MIAGGIVIAELTPYPPLAKIGIAWVSFELLSILFINILWGIVCRLVTKAFFCTIDVIPAHGGNNDEAHAIVLYGLAFEMSKKLDREIQNWTYGDTLKFVSFQNWRAGIFFPVRERVERGVEELQRIYEETGRQPGDLGRDGVAKIMAGLPGGRASWLEKAIVF